MRRTVATRQICLPITALETVTVDRYRFLLAGQGPFLHIYTIDGDRQLLTAQIFEVQAIHGICLGTARLRDDKNSSLQLALFGGSSLAVATVEIGHWDSTCPSCKLTTTVAQAPDWILQVLHHDLEAGCTQFVLLTADDRLFKVSPPGEDGFGPGLDLLGLGPKSFLYSGDISGHKPEFLLVAAGSVFGEVVIWACKRAEMASRWKSYATHRFTAHHGSVFGIRISDQFFNAANSIRLVASCSDDRTIRVWDVSDHESKGAIDPELEVTASTGFGYGTTSNSDNLASVSGHASRIWDVDFLDNTTSSDCNQIIMYLISRGEDATCQVWSLEIEGNGSASTGSKSLNLLSVDHHHFGKSALAWTHYADEPSQFLVSGGADGRIARRPLQLCRIPWEVFYQKAIQDIPVSQKVVSFKEYVVVDMSTVAAISTCGYLLLCWIPEGRDLAWFVDPVSAFNPVTRLCSNSVEGILVSATRAGLLVTLPETPSIFMQFHFEQPVSWMRLLTVTTQASQCHEALLIVTFPDPRLAALVHINLAYIDYEQQLIPLRLPKKSTVTSSCYNGDLHLLFIGFRDGSLGVFSETPHDPTFQFFAHEIHGSDAVTSLQTIDSAGAGLAHLLSTGRGGTFAIHKITVSDSLNECSFQTLYISSPQFGVNLEGAILFSPSSSFSNQPDLVLFGFRSKDFVVWNHTKQTQSFSVDCGGAHRSWAYGFTNNAGAHALVWTKAGAFNFIKDTARTPSILREGGHGREIKALAVRPHSSGQEGDERIVATGAEDTTIQLFAVRLLATSESNDPIDQSECKPLVTLTSHTTGVQHLAFTVCGNYMFSSGGNGELFVWSMNENVPIVGTGVSLLDRMVQASDDSDARILSFDIRPSDDSKWQTIYEGSVSLAVAYSNGKVRVVDYTPDSSLGKGKFTPRLEIVYGTFCFTQVHLYPPGLGVQAMVLAAGTNGYLHGDILETTSTSRIEHRIHQSSILAMDWADLNLRCLIATGGDDNALAVTLLQSIDASPPRPTEFDETFTGNNATATSSPAFCGISRSSGRTTNQGQIDLSSLKPQTVLIPKAHAAALTALKFIHHQKHPWGHRLIIVSAGNDQRVKVWVVKVRDRRSHGSELLEDLQITRVHETWTCVADVSNVDLVSLVERSKSVIDFEVILVGVGLEMLRITVDNEDWAERE